MPDDDELERPRFPTWVTVVAAILIAALALSVVSWLMRAVFALARFGLFVILVLIAFVALRSVLSRRR